MRWLVPALLATYALAADPAPVPVPVVPAGDTVQNPLPPAPPPIEQGAAELRDRLPRSAAIVERADGLWWQGAEPAAAFRLVAVDQHGDPVVDTPAGRVSVQRRLVSAARADAVQALLLLSPLAAEAALGGELRLAEGPLTGLHLRAGEAVIAAGALLKPDPAPAPDRGPDLAALREAITALSSDLDRLDLEPAARRAVGDVLGKLPLSEHAGDIDDASPDFCRRVVRSGWLRSHFPGLASDEAVEQAVRAAETPRPVRRWTGTNAEMAEMRDAFGRGGWMLRTSTRSAWMADHPEPTYFGGMPAMVVVAELAPGADPVRPEAGQVSAARSWRLADGDWLQVAAWTADGRIEVPDGPWGRHVPRRTRTPAVGDWMPPHIVIPALSGDPLLIATAHGAVVPPRDASPAEGERFLVEAARGLPDAAHLDLIGQYLLRYVYDSPDPRRPLLIGNKRDKGDIHQTSLQTLSTAAGGQFRGDCDDLAELYESIAERQGRTAHVIGVPGHAACAWAERRADSWHVFVLQTGPALEFSDAALPTALGRAYNHFDDADTFDPNGLGVLLRFSNENQRGSWRLSWRIFEDPEYARLMIDVQKDWHYSTYQRGIAKMRNLIAANAREGAETANFRELSGLYSFTGQYGLAADHHAKAIELTRDDPLSQLYMQVELLGHLLDAGRRQEAREAALDLLDRRIPEQTKNLGPNLMQVGAQMAATLASHGHRDLAVRALRPAIAMLSDRIAETFGRKQRGKGPATHPVAGLTILGDWLESADFEQNVWDNNNALQQFRRLSQRLAATAILCLERAAPADIAADADLQVLARFVQTWLDRIAFRDIDDDYEAQFRYATAGRAYGTLLGAERFGALLEAAPRGGGDAEAMRRRAGGLVQVLVDAGRIADSTPYWSGLLMEMFDRDRETFDRARAVAVADRAMAAYASAKGTALDHPQIALQAHLAALIRALVAEDEPALRALLKAAADRGDKDWVDDTAQWLGDAARWLPQPWYARVLAAWNDTIGYEPKYFWIAWRAALGKAPAHAIMAAELAVKRFPENADFREELAYMQQVLAQPAAR